MPTLLLNYHGVTDRGGGDANLHCLPKRSFQAQIEHLARNRYHVVSWRELLGADEGDNTLRVAITFDDGHKSDLESARFLKSFGYDALFFIATEYLGQPDYLSPADIVDLQHLGMGIGSHSHHHAPLAPMPQAAVEQELSSSKRALEDAVHASVEHLSFPGGSYNARVVSVGRRVGYTFFYTSDWGLNTKRQFAAGVLRRTSVVNRLDIRQFDALLQLRNYHLRQALFRVKELTKRALGSERYYKLRRSLLSLRDDQDVTGP
jgi:peptidoglycan/xylan/chitin deacetylase (PgdA/CDA1 family)